VARHVFAAKAVKVDINPCVAVPARVSRAFARRGYVPVKGTLNRFPIRATLVPVGGGRHRLYLNTEMRKGADVKVGDRVRLVLELDRAYRVIPTPSKLRAALRKNQAAARAFALLPRAERRDYLLYLNSLKTPDALERNVAKVISHLSRPRRRRRRGTLLARPAGSYARAAKKGA
jgi:hypothetical protein